MTKLLTKKVPYTFNREGYYYFSRRIPCDLIQFYTYPRIVQALRTKSPSAAKIRAMSAAAKLDEYWSHLRLTDSGLFGRSLLKQDCSPNSVHRHSRVLSQLNMDLTLSDALNLYLSQKGANKGKTFQAAANRACSYLVDSCGLKKLTDYSRVDALNYRDLLISKGMVGSSVARVLSSIKAVFNFAISEYALQIENPFKGIYIDRTFGVSRRFPIPVRDIEKIQIQCRLINDELPSLVALISDTGLRLSEATGLLKTDINFENDIPFLSVRPHPWRTLKTPGSTRVVPLVNASLWAARRVSKSNPESVYAFPRYNKKSVTNSNSASAALNKWLHQYVPNGCSMHSFRHSLRDRLRAIECPSDIIDQIGGWARSGVGDSYGEGYSLS